MVVSEFVFLFSVIGKVIGVSEVLFGVIVFVWGNLVGDFVFNIVVVRAGNSNMVIVACFVGLLMNFFVGILFGFLFYVVKYGFVIGYVMFNELILFGGVLMFVLFYAFFVIFFVYKWRVGKNAAYGMIGFYFLFFIVYVLMSMYCIF